MEQRMSSKSLHKCNNAYAKPIAKREDFSVRFSARANNAEICEIQYRGQTVYAFGTCPDGIGKRRRMDNSLLRNAEVEIGYILAGLSPIITEKIQEINESGE